MKLAMAKYKDGEVRTKTKFLWFPKWIDGELRWLEEATWMDRYYCSSYTGGKATHGGTWFAQKWIND